MYTYLAAIIAIHVAQRSLAWQRADNVDLVQLLKLARCGKRVIFDDLLLSYRRGWVNLAED